MFDLGKATALTQNGGVIQLEDGPEETRQPS